MMNRFLHVCFGWGLLVLGWFLSAPLQAQWLSVEVEERLPVAEGYSFENTGPYEWIEGKIRMKLDPNDPANERVHDLKLAPADEEGLVEFVTDFVLLKPVDAARGNGRLLYDVHNRGNKLAVWTFNGPAERSNRPLDDKHMGNGFLMRHGYSVLWTGWNAEVEEDGNDRLTMEAPIAKDGDKAISGQIHVEICVSEPVKSRSFAWSPWGVPKIFPVADLDNSHASLTVRRFRQDTPKPIPSGEWAFARWENDQAVPDATHVYLQEGFQPGYLYDLVYTAENPRVAGVGPASVRDIVSFFKHEAQDSAGHDNPLSGVIEQAYLFGISQSGRFGVHFIHEGFNADPAGRRVFDGALLHVPGAGKGHFTIRFRNATDAGNHHEANLAGTEYFPFSPALASDPVTGQSGSVLDRARKAGAVPKMMYVQSGTEYWARAASLVHTDVEGTIDLELPEEVRVYHVAGSQHLGPGEHSKGEAQQNRGILDDRGPVLRAMLSALDDWVTRDIAPPASRYPRLSDHTLVTLDTFRQQFPRIPGVNLPTGYYQPLRLNFGKRLESHGITDVIPPAVGKPWNTLIPAVNEDGNEISGIVLPGVAVPLGTHAGWNLRDEAFGPPEMLTRFDGMYLPFAVTAEERNATGDPRLSIQERYPTRESYLSKLSEAALSLHADRLLLDEDLVRILEAGAKADYWK